MNCIRVVRAARNVTPAFKRGYFTQTFSDKDKFTTELKGDYPTIVEGLEGEFAKELFRYAYNNNQLGYYKVALEYVNGLNAPHRFAEEEFQASLKDAGVPDVVRTKMMTIMLGLPRSMAIRGWSVESLAYAGFHEVLTLSFATVRRNPFQSVILIAAYWLESG